MSEYLHVEKPFLAQLATLGWTVIDQGQGVPGDPAASLRAHFREWLLPEVFRYSVRAINRTADGREWLTDRRLDDLRDQLLRHPNRSLLEANEAVQALLFKAQVDVNELTGEPDPVAKLIDFAHPERNTFHVINQFRIDTPPLGIEREQERMIQGLLAPDTLLDVLRTCTVFMDTDDGKRIKVVCRYQ